MKEEIVNNKIKNDFDILKDIFSVFKLASKYYSKLCKKLNIKEIDFQALYLIYISEDKCIKMSLLSDELEMAKSGVTILVDRMALMGLVKRREDTEDRRIMKVMLTEKGNQIMDEIFKRNSIFKLSPLDFMNEEEKEVLNNLFRKIKEQF